MTCESWKSIVGYEGAYEVSDHGSVRSVSRVITESSGKTYFRNGRILKQFSDKRLRRSVALSRDGRAKTHFVHALVITVFKEAGPTPGMHCCHFDGDASNNRISNLRWDTPKGNSQDTIRHGRTCVGDRQGRSKLTWEQTREIRACLKSGECGSEIARRFGVSKSSISRIGLNQNWRETV